MQPDAMTEEQLQAIEARAAAATEGEWFANNNDGYSIWRIKAPGFIAIADVIGDSAETDANAAFIAHAREDVPALVAEVRRLQEHIAGLKEILKRIHGRAKSLVEITERSRPVRQQRPRGRDERMD